jgi:hypothetical protein
MGYNAHNDGIRDNATRMQREGEEQRGALAARYSALAPDRFAKFWED